MVEKPLVLAFQNFFGIENYLYIKKVMSKNVCRVYVLCINCIYICLNSVTRVKLKEKNEICCSISTCAVKCDGVFFILQHGFQYGFQHALHKHFQHTLKFDIAFNICYSFQHMLKFSTCCFNIVFYTYYSFQHALKFSTCFQHTLKYLT